MTTVVIGAGIGGLSTAIALAAAGESVIVLERQNAVGGKLRPVVVGGEAYDGCATVMTMRWVFEELFGLAGTDLNPACPMTKLETHARHYWSGGASLDLYADQKRSADAIARFAGPHEAKAFMTFMKNAAAIHNSLKVPFLRSQKPSLINLMTKLPMRQLLQMNPYESLWSALKKQFSDARLVQLFARYATFCGSSPFSSPATLMLVADVEQNGVWRVEGGLHKLPMAMQVLAERLGVKFFFNTDAAQIDTQNGTVSAVTTHDQNRFACEHIVLNGDPQAIAKGYFGQQVSMAVELLRNKDLSFSGLALCGNFPSHGLPLEHHTVFFSDDYEAEFAQLTRQLPYDPTVYICDQGNNRKQVLINAPALPTEELPPCSNNIKRRLQACGLTIDFNTLEQDIHSPKTFAELYPGSNGALYGRASNTWNATFLRPQARTKVQGLYLAGGATHPGPGVPMAALSGMRAAEALLQDRASMRPFRRTAIVGGMSMG